MADESRPSGRPPPPAEQVHLPAPSALPVVVALGVTLTLVGVLISWPIVVLGLLILLVATLRWVRQARAETAELPLEH